MNIQLVLDPGLPLTTADFAAAWNDTPACAAADVAPADPATYFLPPELIAAGLVGPERRLRQRGQQRPLRPD
jgi:hypothetical protein